MKKLILYSMSRLWLLIMPVFAHGATTQGDGGGGGGNGGSASSPPSTGSSTSTSGITATGGWNQSGFDLNWSITPSGSNYNYTYTITNTAEQSFNSVKDFVLQVDDRFTPSNLSQTLFSVSPGILLGPSTLTSSQVSGLPSTIYGVEFSQQSGISTISFVSSYAPAWGSFLPATTQNL